jgi:hypothetical protein
MSKSLSISLSQQRPIFLAILILAALAIMPLPVAAGSLSGDDAYDPAAGSFPELFVLPAVASYSGDDAYDPAAGSYPELFVGAAAVSLSGDDAYDPAAGGLSALAGNIVEEPFCPEVSLAEVGTYSGDDAYDPAAGGIPQLLPLALACALP